MSKSESVLEAIARADKLIAEANAILDPVLIRLGEEERSRLPRPPAEFPSAANVLIDAVAERPALAHMVNFQAHEVTTNLRLAGQIPTVLASVEEVALRLRDARLKWLASAWRQTLDMYTIARSMERIDPTLRTVVAPLSGVFAGGRRRRDDAVNK